MAAEFLACRMLGLTLQDDAAKAFYALEPGTAFSAPAIYAQLSDTFPLPEAELQAFFTRDCHDLWKKAFDRARLPGGAATARACRRSGAGHGTNSHPI